MASQSIEIGEYSAEVRDLLKQHGLRFSRPRAAILAFFLEEDRHVSAEAVHRSVSARGESLSLSTVYLNLAVLCEAGLLRELRGLEGVSLYDSNVDPHAHLVCTVSGRVVDVPDLEISGVPLARYLREKIEAATGWQVEEPRLSFKGVSPEVSSQDD